MRADILSILIWVQTACKGYQQTTKVAASKERVSYLPFSGTIKLSIPVDTIKFGWSIIYFRGHVLKYINCSEF